MAPAERGFCSGGGAVHAGSSPMSACVGPFIGITSDFIEKSNLAATGSYSLYPWYALGKRYGDAVVAAGGIPLMLCCSMSCVQAYAHRLDGLLVTGSAFDIDPALYDETYRHPTTVTRPARTRFEWALVQTFLKLNKPVLGISGGMQLLNVIKGGTLFQHIIEEVPDALNHTQHVDLTCAQHTVEIDEESKLAKALRVYEPALASSLKDPKRSVLRLETNSYHHQGVKVVGRGLCVAARATDGMIEALESTEDHFCAGVQWQPEFCLSPVDIAIFKAFVSAASPK